MGYKKMFLPDLFSKITSRVVSILRTFLRLPGSSARNIGHDSIRQGGIGNRRIRSQRIEEGLPRYFFSAVSGSWNIFHWEIRHISHYNMLNLMFFQLDFGCGYFFLKWQLFFQLIGHNRTHAACEVYSKQKTSNNQIPI